MTRSQFDADAVIDTVTPPPFSTVTDRGDQLLRRRRARRGVLAVAAAVLFAAVAIPAAGRLNAQSSTSPPPGQTDRSRSFFTDTVLAGPSTIVMIRRSECAVVVSVSTDAGSTWSPDRGPTEWRDCGIPVTATYEILGPTVYAATIRQQRYLSRDAGATWQPTHNVVTVVDAFPERVVLRASGPAQAVDPDTGAAYQLARTGSVAAVWAARTAPDGAIWMLGATDPNVPADSQPHVIRSTDRGRTWEPAGTVPAVGTTPLIVPVTTRQAFVLGAHNAKAMVYRTDDAGHTWTSADAPWPAAVAATINTAGQLMVYGRQPTGEPAIWTSPDNGRTFTDPNPVRLPDPIRAGYVNDLLWIAALNGAVAATHDGRTWQRTPPRT